MVERRLFRPLLATLAKRISELCLQDTLENSYLQNGFRDGL